MAAGDQHKLRFLFYIQQTYITTPNHNALYDQSLWNVHNATVIGLDRTNNNVEGYNNRLSNLGGRRKPTVFKTIDIIQVLLLLILILNRAFISLFFALCSWQLSRMKPSWIAFVKEHTFRDHLWWSTSGCRDGSVGHAQSLTWAEWTFSLSCAGLQGTCPGTSRTECFLIHVKRNVSM